eukprot:g3431.t1
MRRDPVEKQHAKENKSEEEQKSKDPRALLAALRIRNRVPFLFALRRITNPNILSLPSQQIAAAQDLADLSSLKPQHPYTDEPLATEIRRQVRLLHLKKKLLLGAGRGSATATEGGGSSSSIVGEGGAGAAAAAPDAACGWRSVPLWLRYAELVHQHEAQSQELDLRLDALEQKRRAPMPLRLREMSSAVKDCKKENEELKKENDRLKNTLKRMQKMKTALAYVAPGSCAGPGMRTTLDGTNGKPEGSGDAEENAAQNPSAPTAASSSQVGLYQMLARYRRLEKEYGDTLKHLREMAKSEKSLKSQLSLMRDRERERDQVSTAPDEWLSWPRALQHQIILDFLGQKNGKFNIDTTLSEEEFRFPADIDGAPSLLCAGIMVCGVYEPNAFFAFMILLHDSINEWWHAAAAAMRVRRKEKGDLQTRLDADSVQRLPLCSKVTRIRGHLRHVTEAVLCEQRRRVNKGFGEDCENVMDLFVRNPEQLLALLMGARRDHDQRIASGRADGTMGLAPEGAEETSCHDITNKVFPAPSAGVKNHVQRFLWQLATQEGMPEKLLLHQDHDQNAEINARSFSSFAEDLYGRLWPDRLREWADQVRTGQPLENGLEVEDEMENAEAVLDHVVTSDEMLKPDSSATEDTANRHRQHPVGNFVCLEMLDFFCATVTRTTGRAPDVVEQDDHVHPSSARTSHEQLLLKVTNATRETFFTAVLDLLRALLELRDRDLHAEIHQRVVSSTEEPTEDTSSNPLVMSRAEVERSLNDVVRKKGRKHYDDFLKYAEKLRVTQLLRVAAMLVLEPDHGVGEDNAEDRTPRAEMPGLDDRLFTSRWRGRRNLAAEDISLLLNFCYSDQQLPGLKEVAVFAVRNMAHRNAENQKRIDELVRATK